MKPATSVLATLALSCTSLALAGGTNSYPHYRLIVLPTLGGPNSYIDCCGIQPIINNLGSMVGVAEASPDNPSLGLGPDETWVCGTADAFLNVAVEWDGNRVRSLGALPGGHNSFAANVTDTGLIVGTSEAPNPAVPGTLRCNAALWWQGKILDLGSLGGTVAVAVQANLRGQVIGIATNTIPDSLPHVATRGAGLAFDLPTQQRAFLWERGHLRDLGTLGGPDAQALFINERGDVTGASYTTDVINDSTGRPTEHPFLWRDGHLIDLGTLGGTLAYPAGLNNFGDVVGKAYAAGDAYARAFLWHNGVLKDLGTLGGTNSEAWAITDTGLIVGRADIPGSSTHHAFLWKQGRMWDLGILSGQTCSTAYAVNRNEQVVGDTGVCNPDGLIEGPPFYSEHGLPMVSIESLLIEPPTLTLADATNINERGEIACQGFDADGNLRSCLLVPVRSR